jgi:hypothetical protein
MKTYSVTYSDRMKYVYFRVPKAATQSMIDMLNVRTIITGGFPISSKMADKGYNIEYREEWDDYVKFTLVRNPVGRIVSCYKDKIAPDRPWNQHFRAKLNISPGQNINFREFLELLQDDSTLRADEHWAPQVELMPPIDKLQLIMRLETICDDIDMLSVKLGRELSLHSHNRWTTSVPLLPEKDDISLIRELYHDDFTQLRY